MLQSIKHVNALHFSINIYGIFILIQRLQIGFYLVCFRTVHGQALS